MACSRCITGVVRALQHDYARRAVSSLHGRASFTSMNVQTGIALKRVGQRHLTVFVRPEEHPSFIKVSTDGHHVADLVAAAVRAFLLPHPLSAVTLSLDIGGGTAGVALDSTATLEHVGVTSMCRLVLSRPCVVLSFRWELKKGKTDVTTVRVSSEEDYARLLQGRMLHLFQRGKGNRLQQTALCTLRAAVDAQAVVAAQKGAYMMMSDPAVIMMSDISNLKSYRSHAASNFELLSTRSLASSNVLIDAYGTLTLLNGGRHVVFTDVTSCDDFLECDGLVTSSTGSVVLLNEATIQAHVDDVERVAWAVDSLKEVIAAPMRYKSTPAGVIEKLAGLRIVPILSSETMSDEAMQACRDKGIPCNVRDDSGFECTLSPPQMTDDVL